MAHPKLAEVRQRYGFRCGYCGVSEIDCGGELTVDHYTPKRGGGGDDEDNLVYCCFRCNHYKRDFAPSPEDIVSGRRILHPFLDNTSDHFHESATDGFLVAHTDRGRFHIHFMRLNRPSLIEYRKRRHMESLRAERLEALEAEQTRLLRTITERETYAAGIPKVRKSRKHPER